MQISGNVYCMDCQCTWGVDTMSSSNGHPQRERKIRKYVEKMYKPGDTFLASDVSKPLNLTAVEVGNCLKFIKTLRIARRPFGSGATWEVVSCDTIPALDP